MCGIFGYRGKRRCSNIVLEGLKSLEYRGYDSWGIALKTKEGIVLKKEVGQISEAKDLEDIDANIGIGHTRWATHGKVEERNSHPHHDEENNFFVVHNGIVENYEELKKDISEKFYSQTDSEVIPKLISKYSSSGFEKAVEKVVKMLEGNFAFVAIEKGSDKMIAARKGSPLVIGKGKDEFFISSDIQSFIQYTKDVFYLNDGEMAVIDDGIRFIDFIKDEEIKKDISKVGWDIKKAMKSGYDHFMEKEIHEQPASVMETINGYSRKDLTIFEEHLKGMKIEEMNRIIITACGTSWHAALVAEYWLEGIARMPVEVEYASEFRYRNPVIEDKTLVIAISQSGETADTIAAIKEAKERKAKVVSICNVIGSTIDRISDATFYTRAGPEIGVASTKAFTTQLAILFMLSLHIAEKRGIMKKDDQKRWIGELKKIPDKMESILENKGCIMKIAEEYHQKSNALFLGRGVNYPIALEGALKLKEISYIHAEGYPAAEMKHGPIALIDKELPSVFICVKDRSYEKVISNIQEVKARKGLVIAIATEKDEQIEKIADEVIMIPKTEDELTPFLSVIPLQMLAYFIAGKRGCEIDKPRNLAKSVTVE